MVILHTLCLVVFCFVFPQCSPIKWSHPEQCTSERVTSSLSRCHPDKPISNQRSSVPTRSQQEAELHQQISKCLKMHKIRDLKSSQTIHGGTLVVCSFGAFLCSLHFSDGTLSLSFCFEVEMKLSGAAMSFLLNDDSELLFTFILMPDPAGFLWANLHPLSAPVLVSARKQVSCNYLQVSYSISMK